MASGHWEQAGPTLTELHRLSLLVQDEKKRNAATVAAAGALLRHDVVRCL